MARFKKGIYFLWVLALAGTAAAYDEDFGPYKDGEAVHPFAATVLEMGRHGTDGTQTFAAFGVKDDPRGLTVMASGTGSDGTGYQTVLTVENAKGRKLFTSLPVKLSNINPTAFAADLNGDGKTDFVLCFSNYSEEDVKSGESFILLSKRKGFDGLQVNSTWDKNAFVDLKGDGKCELVCQTEIQDHGGAAQNPLNKFYVLLFRVLGFQGNELVPMDPLDARYPKFVARFYSAERKNHKETQLLTADQKKALLGKYPLSVSKLEAKKTK